ncbi:MAG: hypothetical protein ACFN4G_02370 [Mitsuokella sp.]
MDSHEITHVLLHALTEECVAKRIDGARSQQEVYTILKELPYFSITMEEFQRGIEELKEKRGG